MHTIPEKIYACWLGKAIGGTLGGPWEGHAGPLALSFYDPVPEGVLPNDDLDLQIVWAHHLLATGARKVTPELLAAAWGKHVQFPMDEYGICPRNQAYGLTGAEVGAFDNWFGECMGAAIRSEIWACMSPGDPARAAGMAWADAVCDHCGEGVWAEVFFAALQSAAFVESDQDRLLDGALAFLPESSRVRRAIEDTRRSWSERRDWEVVRRAIMEKYGTFNFTDVAVNLAFTILGWLAGEGDFGRSICIATNCGEDTDCTAATLGALMGIIDPSCIPQEWRAPIGEEIKLSRGIVNFTPPRTLRELTEWTLRLREQFAADQPRLVEPARSAPARHEASPIRIPALLWSSRDEGVWSSDTAPEPNEGKAVDLPGHWIRDEGQFGGGSTALLRVVLRVEEGQTPLLMAFSYARTALWIDGRRVEPRGPYVAERSSAAPSFHRNYPGYDLFDPGTLEVGAHQLVVAWDRGSGEPFRRDLVIGACDMASRLWYPHALAQKR